MTEFDANLLYNNVSLGDFACSIWHFPIDSWILPYREIPRREATFSLCVNI